MAIAILSVKVGKAGKAAPHAEYIMREGRYADLAEARARGPESRQLERLEATGSGNMPAWARHAPVLFWQASDRHERAGGSTYREMEIALPRELTPAQRADLVRTWVDQELGGRHAYQWAIHVPKALDGGEQPHVHLMFSERQIDDIERGPEQYFKRWNSKNPERGGCRKGFLAVDPTLKGAECAAARAAELKALRERWGVVCNQALEQAGRAERIDLRSHAERGTGLVPEPKAGPKAWRNPARRAEIIEFRAARAERAAALAEVERLIPNMGAEIIQLEVAAKKRAERAAWLALPLAELQQEEMQLRPLTIEALIRRRPEAKAVEDRYLQAEKQRDAAAAEIARHTPGLEEWRREHWLRAWIHDTGAWRHKQANQVEDWLLHQQSLQKAADAEMAAAKAEAQRLLSALRSDAEGERDSMLERHARISVVLQARETQLAQEQAEQAAREAAQQALQAQAQKLAAQLIEASELRRSGKLKVSPELGNVLDQVEQNLPGGLRQHQDEICKRLEQRPETRERLAELLKPHEHELGAPRKRRGMRLGGGGHTPSP